VSGRDITEGRASRAIAVDLGIQTGNVWQNTGVDYDIAIGGVPFLLDATEQHPYERSTAPFRKNQFDTQRDPGEQSITGWWLRSQSSFHAGQGVLFYDPFANPFSTTLASNSYRYSTSFGVNPWTFGQCTLLNRPASILSTTNALHLESVQVSGADKIAVLDTNIKIVDASTSSTLVTASSTIYSMATDGTNIYYIDGGNVYSKALTGGSATTLFTSSTSVTSSAMHWVKQRLVGSMNNNIYELVGGTGAALPTPVYTHPNTAWQWTDFDEAGPAIYASGYAGANSAIYMFVLNTSGAMPVLTSGIIAAQLPPGEVIYSMYSHLGTYLMIGTNKGVRVASVDQATGYLTYGPLLVNTVNPVRGFAARDSYIWFGTSIVDGINNYSGTWRIDLSNEIDNLRFAVAQDVYAENTIGGTADVAFLGNTNQLAFLASPSASSASSSLGLWLTSATELYPSGYLQTGYIRYNTLEPKNFKRIAARGDYGIPASVTNPSGSTKGSMTISSVDLQANRYDIVTYDNNIGTPEATISNPIGAQDAIALRFTLNRDATDITLSPIFKGYQVKAVPATPRTRIIKIPLLAFDVDTDKYNATVGYEGYGYDKLAALEDIEAAGDVVTLQDFRTGETSQCLIEELSFVNKISPDKRLNNFGGTIIVTVRTV
jgi:hypothetical protein